MIDLAINGVGAIDEPTFRQNQVLVDATAFRVMPIGESVSALPEVLMRRHPSLPWARMIGMRHRLAHDYDGLDPACSGELFTIICEIYAWPAIASSPQTRT